MAVYWSVAIITVLINLFPSKNEKQYSRRLIISLIPLFIYGAFRVDFGLDYETYAKYFEEVKIFGQDSDERMEIGYYYLNKLLPTFRSLLVFQTLLLCAAYYYLFKWYIPSKYAWIGFVLLFLNGPLTVFFMLSGIRNGIAISILILSTYYIHKRKIFPFIVLILLASLFHKSVLIMAPIAYFIGSGKKLTRKSMIIWLSIMLFVTVASATVILDYASLFISEYFDRYETYIEFAKEQGKGAGVLVSLFSLLISALFLYIINGKLLTEKENTIVKLTLLYFLAHLLGPLNMRMSQYFASFFVSGTIIVLNKGGNKILKLTYFAAIFAYLIYSLKLWFENPYFSYNIYESILF